MGANYRTSVWDDPAKIAKLRELWERGVSASLIAAQIGGVTRNAVLGKAFRLRLPMRVAVVRKAWTRPTRRKGPERRRETLHLVPKPRKSRLAELLCEPLPAAAPDDVARLTLMDLEREHCRWPVGDPKDAGFGFCGCRAYAGLPYCETHVRRAYTPATLKTEPGPSFNVSIRQRRPAREMADA